MASQGGSAQRPSLVIRDGQAPAPGMDQPPWRVGPACGDSRERQDHRDEGLGDEPPERGCEKCGGGGDGWRWGGGQGGRQTRPPPGTRGQGCRGCPGWRAPTAVLGSHAHRSGLRWPAQPRAAALLGQATLLGALGLLCVPDFVPTAPESMHERLRQRAPERPALPLPGGSEHSDRPAPPRTRLCTDHTAKDYCMLTRFSLV